MNEEFPQAPSGRGRTGWVPSYRRGARSRYLNERVGGSHGRGTRGDVVARRVDNRGVPPGPKPESPAGGAVPVAAAARRRVRSKMRPKGGKAARGAELPGGEGTESSTCKVLAGGGVCWVTAVATAEASAELVPRSEGAAKTEANAMSAVEKNARRPERRSTVITEADTRSTNLPEGEERPSVFIRGPFARNSETSGERKRAPPRIAPSGRGTSPPKPTPGVGEERVRSSPPWMRKIPLPWTGVRLLDPLRSVFRSGLWRTGQKIGVPVGAALMVLECVVERGGKPEPPLDACVVIPHFVNALERLVIQTDAEFRAPKVASESSEDPELAASFHVEWGPLPLGV